jgi:Ca2+-binding RTX toxin-like protein
MDVAEPIVGADVGPFHGGYVAPSKPQRIQTTIPIRRIESASFPTGDNDTIYGQQGNDTILGGNGDDLIDAATEHNVVFGDSGLVDNVIADNDRFDIDLIQSLALTIGGSDTITSGPGDDIIVGGQAGDVINAGVGQNIVLGDNALILSGVAVNGTPDLAQPLTGQPLTFGQIGTIAPLVGGNDVITTGVGRDIIFGGAGDDRIIANGGEAAGRPDGNNIVFGDHGFLDFVSIDRDPRDIDIISSGDLLVLGGGITGANDTSFAANSVDINTGGNDTITTGVANDIIVGGPGSDVMASGDGQGIVFGDSGQLLTLRLNPAVGYDLNPPFGAHPFQIKDLLSIQSSTDGGDRITDGSGSDIVVGGAGNDTVFSGAGNDLVFGAYGEVYTTNPIIPIVPATQLPALDPDLGRQRNYPGGRGALEFTAGVVTGNHFIAGVVAGDHLATVFGGHVTLTQNADLQGNPDNDYVEAGDGNDVVMGEQGNDTAYGGNGDDDLIGGSNVAGAQDGSDIIDGGTGFDVIAGDNATVWRRDDSLSPRFITLNAPAIYNTYGDINSSDLAPTLVLRNDPTGALHRNTTLFDHAFTTDASRYGSDTLAGGANNDEICGELGNDNIQGDGSIVLNAAGAITNPVGAASDPGNGALTVLPAVEAATDGDDYIEGGGGSDVIFGGLGQDDIIGGSSSLFGLTTRDLRPDTDPSTPGITDILFGGAGTRIARNLLGTGADSTTGAYADHARDADTILGDNGNLFRLVRTISQAPGAAFLTFVYDSTNDINSDPANPFGGQSRGPNRIIPRAYQLLDYSYAVQGANDIGAADLIHAEDGDDFVHGEVGNDVLYGDGWDDQLIGGTGRDKIFGGTGEDSILGDDGLLKIARDGLAEPLYGLTATTQTGIALPGPWTGAVIDITGILKTTVDLTVGHGLDTWLTGSYADVIYGGLGDDWIHGGNGDDAISGAEALPQFFSDTRSQTVNPFQYNRDLTINYWVDPLTGQQSLFYNADFPRTKILAPNGDDFILNFDSFDVAHKLIEDGKDWMFGDGGNDVLFGGTGQDRLWGGQGDDYLQLDDNLNTSGGLNTTSDDATPPNQLVTAGAGDWAYGGDGLDVLIANTGYDRMFDWGGEFNSFIVPFSHFGEPTIYRSPNPHIQDFLKALAAASGDDPNLTEPSGEMGFFVQSDPQWQDNHGSPRDPQPGNYPKGDFDNKGSPEDDTLQKPLQTAAGSTPTGHPPLHNGTESLVQIQKSINAADPLHPTAAEDANDPSTARRLLIGSSAVWTYLVTNSGAMPVTISSITDDAGTTSPSDDFHPAYVSGDANNNGKLDPGETWLYTSQGVVTYTVKAGLYGNIATVTAKAGGGGPITASDPNYHFGTDTLVNIRKAINAADALHPTATEDANDPANPRLLGSGTSVVWTYLLTNPGVVPLTITSITDDAGTPGVPGDDFHPVYVSGDTNNNHLLDPGETWLYTSTGAVYVSTGQPVPTYQAQAGLYGNTATATATGTTGTTVTASDVNWHFGSTPQIFVRKLTNGVYSPTATGQLLPAGTLLVWTYEVTDAGDAPVKVTSIRDDAGTPNDPTDDFTATAVLQPGTNFNVGDTNLNGLLDPGEVFLFTSTGVSLGSPTNWSQAFQTVLTYTDTSGASLTPGFAVDPVQTPNSFNDNIFTGGGSKDVLGITQWQWKYQMPQDKDDLEHGSAPPSPTPAPGTLCSSPASTATPPAATPPSASGSSRTRSAPGPTGRSAASTPTATCSSSSISPWTAPRRR